MVHSGLMRWKRYALWGNKVAGNILERLPVLSLFKNDVSNSEFLKGKYLEENMFLNMKTGNGKVGRIEN